MYMYATQIGPYTTQDQCRQYTTFTTVHNIILHLFAIMHATCTLTSILTFVRDLRCMGAHRHGQEGGMQSPQTLPGASIPGPRLQTPNLPTPGKKSCGCPCFAASVLASIVHVCPSVTWSRPVQSTDIPINTLLFTDLYLESVIASFTVHHWNFYFFTGTDAT